MTHGYPIDAPLTDNDIQELVRGGVTPEALRALPVDEPFTLAEALKLRGHDVPGLAAALRRAPVDAPFSPAQVAQLASLPVIGADHVAEGPLSPDEFTSHVTRQAHNIP